jgi:hypothetical protein
VSEQGSEREPTAAEVVRLLDRIPGAREAIQEGIEQARRGEGIPLDELVADERD